MLHTNGKSFEYLRHIHENPDILLATVMNCPILFLASIHDWDFTQQHRDGKHF